MNEERIRILKMLEEGKISVEEATQLIEAVETPRKTEITPQGKPKWLKVRVQDGEDEKVSVNLPLSLARVALKFIPQQARGQMEAQGIDIDALLSAVTETKIGKLVEVQDGDEHVE
ncbi:MAG: hypothetical protein J7M27_06110, partial [Candidatus Latescibacteria bacterium]|nr:hypothetical protein [Candidatus Latescibacterota bacterium]